MAKSSSDTPRSQRFPTGAWLLERYQIVERLGGGLEGDVYKAEDNLLRDRVALKFLKRDSDDLFKEVRIARQIDHENVCRVHDCGYADGRPYVSMALYPTSLATVLASVRRYPPETACDRGVELSNGLAAIHAKGILHRDLKPGNVLLDDHHRIRISDFGLAHLAAGTDGVRLGGTPAYMAPELLPPSFSAPTVRSDLYALGLVLYQMFTGELPFRIPAHGLKWVQWAQHHRAYLRRPPSEWVAELGSDLDAVILKCLRPNPEDRPESASEVAAVLSALRPGAPAVAAASLSTRPAAETKTETLPPPTGDAPPLDVYLRRVAADHATLLPFFEQGGDVLLENVYVELQLGAERPGPTQARTSAVFAGSPLQLGQMLALEPERYPWVTRRWLLLGDPGSGKTTLLRHFAARLAREGDAPWVPLLEPLSRWLREPGDLFTHAERRRRDGRRRPGALAAALKELAGEGRLLVLLDGLDEVPRKSRADAGSALRDLADQWPRMPIVVTSRPIGVERPHPDFTELELLPFDLKRRRSFLARWLGRARDEQDEQHADELLEVLAADSRLEELAGNPLYLTLMALLFESGQRPERNRARLYDQVFEMLYEGRHRPEPRALPHREAAHRALCHLAFGMTLDNLGSASRRELETRLLRKDAQSVRTGLAVRKEWHKPHVFLEELAERTGILGPHDGRDADWRFWHRTFREALTAEELAAQGLGLAFAGKLQGDEGRWAEPYALLAGRVSDPDDLVLALARKNQALGLRAVATAPRLRQETLAEVLGLSADWQERRKVYEQIPQVLEDPERALALVDQLRRSSRDGNDLFFLERTITKVCRRWPKAAKHARQLERRFFDHIPTPPKALFRWVDTPHKGRVALWCEIPAGTFLMGDPKSKSLSGKHPRCSVEIVLPFRMAAVPVTNQQYAAFDPSKEKLSPHHPAVRLTWYEAMTFCRWLGQALPETRGARLPTEEEWEYACRAGSKTAYWSGDKESNLAHVGWYRDNSASRTHPVGRKPANPWGLYDVHGNVWEWTLSPRGYDSDRESHLEIDPAKVSVTEEADLAFTGGGPLVVRGGSYANGAGRTQSAYRSAESPRSSREDQGMRIVLPSPLPKP